MSVRLVDMLLGVRAEFALQMAHGAPQRTSSASSALCGPGAWAWAANLKRIRGGREQCCNTVDLKVVHSAKAETTFDPDYHMKCPGLFTATNVCDLTE